MKGASFHSANPGIVAVVAAIETTLEYRKLKIKKPAATAFRKKKSTVPCCFSAVTAGIGNGVVLISCSQLLVMPAYMF